MKLNEWQYMNPPQVAGTSGQITFGSSNTGFKQRFLRLLTYHMTHRKKTAVTYRIKTLTNDSFLYIEHHKNPATGTEYDVEYSVFIEEATEAWRLIVRKDGKYPDDLRGTGWTNLLRELRPYLSIPTVGTPEYKGLLVEWVEMKKNSSSSYKKRFEKLIKYHIDHASSELESITKKDIKDDGFRLSEHYDNGHHEFDRDIVVSYDKDSDTFFFRIFIDGKEVDSILRKGYEAFVAAAEGYMFLPDSGTQAYDELLTEWVAMKSNNNSSQPASSSSSKTNKEKFKELTEYMKKHKAMSTGQAEVVRLDDSGFTYKEHRKSATGNAKNDFTLTILVGFGRGPYYQDWKYELYMDTQLVEETSGTGFEKFLWHISAYFNTPKVGSPEHRSLIESVESSIADDFKLYENLWDDEGKRFRVIMVVDDEEYTFGTYDSRDRANEVAMEVRDARGVDTYIEEV